MTVTDAISTWFERRKRAWSSVPHRQQVERLCEQWRQMFGSKEVREITLLDVEAYEEKRDDGERSGSALNQERVYIRQFFRWCMEHGLRADDPTRTWEFRSTHVKRKYVALTKEQELRLVLECPPWLARFVKVAIKTGLREGSIRQLHSNMIVQTPDGPNLVVPGSVVKTRNPIVQPVTEELMAALGDYQGPLFSELPNATAVWRAFKAAAWRAGLPPETSPHDLRRTFVARLTSAGVPTHMVMALGGWKTMGIVVRHYASQVPRQAALAALGSI